MNYIKEINAFYDHMEWNPVSPSAVNLWHALMHINNKAMWKETFTVAGNVLLIKSRLSESSFKRARNELQSKGYIHYIPGKSGQAPTYKMISLCKDRSYHTSPTSIHEVGEHSIYESAAFRTSEEY